MKAGATTFPAERVFAFLAASAVLLTMGCSRTEATAGTPATNAAAPTTTVGTVIDDSLVTTKIKAALLSDPLIKGSDIKVETRKGVVQLGGFVDNQTAVDRAVLVASRVVGVVSVDNAMTFKSGRVTVGNEVDDSIVTTRIKSAFFADPTVKGADIGVVTRKAKVQLTGFVDNQKQIDRAVAIARGTKDVLAVENELKLKK
jgi:hyperosmotically inducible protein